MKSVVPDRGICSSLLAIRRAWRPLLLGIGLQFLAPLSTGMRNPNQTAPKHTAPQSDCTPTTLHPSDCTPSTLHPSDCTPSTPHPSYRTPPHCTPSRCTHHAATNHTTPHPTAHHHTATCPTASHCTSSRCTQIPLHTITLHPKHTAPHHTIPHRTATCHARDHARDVATHYFVMIPTPLHPGPRLAAPAAVSRLPPHRHPPSSTTPPQAFSAFSSSPSSPEDVPAPTMLRMPPVGLPS